jgi:hypothetical protein
MGANIGFFGSATLTLRCDKTLVATLLFIVVGCTRQAADDVGAGGAGSEHDTVSSAGDENSGLGWCDVEPVIQSKCQRCHTDPLANGAPFALLGYEDTQVIDKQGKSRAQRMRAAIAEGFMPATFVKLTPPVEKLGEDERSNLLQWLDAGAPLGDDSACR